MGKNFFQLISVKLQVWPVQNRKQLLVLGERSWGTFFAAL